MNYRKYVHSTIGYGIFAVVGLVAMIYSLFNQNYLLLVISVLIMYVSLDNFFCGHRLKKCGIDCKSHYTVPPFLKKK